MDMYYTYKYVISRYFKKAVICVDSFHVIKHINDDLSRIRIRVMKNCSPDSTEYYLLKHFNFLLMDRNVDLDNPPRMNRRLGHIINYRGLLELILSIDESLKKAYHLKEDYCIFNSTSDYEYARSHFSELYDAFVSADIEEFRELVTLMKNWKNEIINSFMLYHGKRVNNSIAESVNARISTLLFNTKGIRNSERRRKRIMYSINKDSFVLK